MDTILLGDPNGAAMYAAIVFLFGALVAAIVVAVAANLGARRAGLAVGAALVVAAGALGYWLYLTPFYAVELAPGELRLRSFYPSRAVTLAKGDVDGFERRNEVTKNTYTVVLVVHAKDGRVFTSGTLRPQDLADAYARLQAWLAAP